ncbi:hypothetical protein QFC21_000535 [Naganishia friedmannii]|uniref:Uncharacterized protein n=1 Tax=Naganishia friedmannii TaxID=89922 RepID=A0ACC2WCS9_9TREE|nr:hypothetical protein QFC21_000535 [Naganishia friedmannii]
MPSNQAAQNGSTSTMPVSSIIDTSEESEEYTMPSNHSDKISHRLLNGNGNPAGTSSTSTVKSLSALMGTSGTSHVRTDSSTLPGYGSPASSDADAVVWPKKTRPKPIRTHHSVLDAHRNGTSRSPAVPSNNGMAGNRNGHISRPTSASGDPDLVPVFLSQPREAERDPALANSISFASGGNHLSRPSSSQGSGPSTPGRLLGDFVNTLRQRSGVTADAGTATTVHAGPVQPPRISGYTAPGSPRNAKDLDEDVIEILEEMPKSTRVPSRSPSFELLTEEAFQRTTPAKKRKFSTMPPEDASTARESRLLFAEPAAPATNTEMITHDSSDGEELLLERIAGNPEFEVDADDVAQSLADELVVEAATGAVNRSETLPKSVAPSTSAENSASISTAATKPARPTVFFKVPTSANTMANAMTPTLGTGESTPFLVSAPISSSAKGKEPIRSAAPFERKASPPIAQITTAERQQLWIKQAGIPFQASGSMDIDALLHAREPEDDPFIASQSDQNAIAGPSFAYPDQKPPEADKAYTHLLAEPRGSYGMSKDFDYRRFNEPLLDCINSLPLHEQNGSHIRVVLEAYYSQSSTDHAPPIRIDGGDRDEFPPAEFKYSDEVYYSDRVPKPWLGKGCECIDPTVGPLKGFAYNADGTLKDCQYPTWECGPQCDCPPACKNRVMQKGRSSNVKLQVYKTRKKAWGKCALQSVTYRRMLTNLAFQGVRALSSFPKGTFVGLYSGELIPEDETDGRGEIYNAIERTYLFDLDHWHIKQPPAELQDIDPAGAYIANQAATLLNAEDEKDQQAEVEGREVSTFNSFFTVDAFHWGILVSYPCHSSRTLAITAKKDVRKGDELCISYSGPPDSDEQLPMMETDEQLSARTGGKDNGKRNVVKKRKGGTAHKQKATKTPEKMEKGRCQWFVPVLA